MAEEKSKATITDGQVDKIALTTGQILAEQDKKKIKIHLDPDVKRSLEAAKEEGKKVEWPFEVVTINGYTYQIQKGVEVEVPISVAQVLENAGMI